MQWVCIELEIQKVWGGRAVYACIDRRKQQSSKLWQIYKIIWKEKMVLSVAQENRDIWQWCYMQTLSTWPLTKEWNTTSNATKIAVLIHCRWLHGFIFNVFWLEQADEGWSELMPLEDSAAVSECVYPLNRFSSSRGSIGGWRYSENDLRVQVSCGNS